MNAYLRSARKSLRRITPFQMITISFFVLILIGSLLLCLPVSQIGPNRCSYLDALFTSGSAVCVTGLVVFNTVSRWSLFGQAVILVLIQIGGLGVITFVIAVSIFSGKPIGLRQRDIMQNAINAPQIGGIIRFTRFLLFFTFACEAGGALLLAPVLIRDYGPGAGLWKAVFHSVSAFCNAGFDILGTKIPFASLTGYRGSLSVNLVVMALIISGGLGFYTWQDLFSCRFRRRKMRMQTKVILLATALLILIPALFFFIFEFRNEPAGTRVLMSLFQSVTTRTAGFNTADIRSMSQTAQMIMILLMLTGGSPGSTAGGMKTTTLAVVLMTVACCLKQRKDVSTFGRSLSQDTVRKAFSILILYIVFFLSGSMIISMIEQLPILDCMFECASALGTVGLSTGITPSLGSVSKIILILFMYFGRVGGLTLAFAALSGANTAAGRLPEGSLMIG